MKLLMFLARQFAFRPFERTLPDAADGGGEVQVLDAAVVFVHAEPQDETNASALETKREPCKAVATNSNASSIPSRATARKATANKAQPPAPAAACTSAASARRQIAPWPCIQKIMPVMQPRSLPTSAVRSDPGEGKRDRY